MIQTANQQPQFIDETFRRPLCPTHGNTMRVGSSRREIRYFYCRVEGCKHSQSAARNLHAYKPVAGNQSDER